MKIKLRGDAQTRKVWLNDEPLSPTRSWKYHNHSPDGFNWGYGGSGPAQLALAILLELFPFQRVRYQDFKWRYISGLPFEKSFDVEIEFDEQDYFKD